MKPTTKYSLIGALIGLVIWFALGTWLWSILIPKIPTGKIPYLLNVGLMSLSTIIYSAMPIWIGAIAGYIIGKGKSKQIHTQLK